MVRKMSHRYKDKTKHGREFDVDRRVPMKEEYLDYEQRSKFYKMHCPICDLGFEPLYAFPMGPAFICPRCGRVVLLISIDSAGGHLVEPVELVDGKCPQCGERHDVP